jgi:hypothetical protein
MPSRVLPLAAALCLLALLLSVPPSSPARQIEGSVFPDLKVGSVGHFKHSKDGYWKTRVVEIIGKDSMLLEVGGKPPTFMVKGYPTKDLADDELVELEGDWKVTGTTRYEGKTYKVVEPVKAKK